MDLKISSTNYLKKLKVISVALSKVQQDYCTISEATEIWIEIINYFKRNNLEIRNKPLKCERPTASKFNEISNRYKRL